MTTARETDAYQPLAQTSNSIRYPAAMKHEAEVKHLAKGLSKDSMKKHLEYFTSFHTRYYKSSTGVQSATWLYEQVADAVTGSGADRHGATVEQFAHPWGQFSVIARIPGQSNTTVVVSAHQDSINLFLPSFLAAPGADDDGSGTVTILETLQAFLQSDEIVQGQAPNTVEFHWYSGEEGGLLGSQAVWAQYKKEHRDVKAMLQQDMTGYIQGTLDAGREEAIAVVVDFVDPALTRFIKDVITSVSLPPFPPAPRVAVAFSLYTDTASTAISHMSKRNAATHARTTHRPADRAILRRWPSRARWKTPTRRSTRRTTRSSTWTLTT